MSKRRCARPRLRAGLLAALSIFPLAGWSAVAGQFQFVAGDVRILSAAGQSRPAQKGQDISEGETIVTGSGASAQLRMIDGGLLALRPDSQLKMDAYVFKGREDGSEKANMSLVKGGLRAISGLIGKTNKQNYAITTPTATIGIRGTDHEPVVVPPPPPGVSLPHPPGTYDKVNVGATTLSNQAGTTIVNPNQVGFAGLPNQVPSILLRVPDFYRVTPLPVARQQGLQQSNANSGNQASNTGNGSSASPSTTSAASGSAGGDAMRLTPAENLPSTLTASTNTASLSTAVLTPTASLPTVALTGEDDKGNSANLTTQVETTTNGTNVLGADRTAKPQYLDVGISSGWKMSSEDGQSVYGPAAIQNLTGAVYKGTADSGLASEIGQGKAGIVINDEGLQQFVGRAEYKPLGSGTLASTTGENNALVRIGDAVNRDVGKTNVDGIAVSWGRWAGGQLEVYDRNSYKTGATPLGTIDNSDRSLHWVTVASAVPGQLVTLPRTGEFVYRLDSSSGFTSPTDSRGNLGTLTDARVSANFDTKRVVADVKLNINATDISINASNMVLGSGGGFSSNERSVLPAAVTTVTCAPACGAGSIGYINGQLLGQNAGGAALAYGAAIANTGTTANTTGNTNTMLPTQGMVVNGVAVLKR